MSRAAGRWNRAVLAAAALAALALFGCPAQQVGPPPVGPDAPGEPGGPEEPGGSTEPSGASSPVEPGFTPCCGSARYRIEIECGEMLKRCYEFSGGRWRQTYGRHCKEQLGEGCYLENCDAKCY